MNGEMKFKMKYEAKRPVSIYECWVKFKECYNKKNNSNEMKGVQNTEKSSRMCGLQRAKESS